MNTPKYRVAIDWLSATRAGHFQDCVNPPYSQQIFPAPEVPRFGYRKAMRFDDGSVVYYDGSTGTMGAHFQYSGTTIGLVDAQGDTSGLTLMKTHLEMGDKITRLDLAIDVLDDPDILPEVQMCAEMEAFKGTARKLTIVRSTGDDGFTVYAGSRTSERFVRVYNKSAQMKQPGLWTRIEVELKGDSARMVGRAIVDPHNGGLAMVAKSVIRRVVDFDCTSYRRAVRAKDIEIGKASPKETDTRAWILGQVAKAIANYTLSHPQEDIVAELDRKVCQILGWEYPQVN